MTERTITTAAYTGDIVSRLRNWRGLHLAHGGELFDEAADEIERLRLTDDERQAIRWIVGDDISSDGVSIQATMRGLLERTRGPHATPGDCSLTPQGIPPV